MSSNNVISQEGSHANQAEAAEFEVADETPDLHATVELEIQGKVDTNHPDATPAGLTLEAEERMAAREAEIKRTRERADSRVDSDREARTRRAARQGSTERRRTFAKRAASVDEWAHPDMVDPRAQLTREQLREVNRAAARFDRELEGWTRAAISRRLAEAVIDRGDVASAVIAVFDELQQAPGQVIPIEAVGAVDRGVVSIEGTVTTLWKPSHPSIQQVGLIDDGTDTIKFTIWKKSQARWVEEGETVRLYGLEKNWYQGRCSVAVTYWSRIEFPDRDRWWNE